MTVPTIQHGTQRGFVLFIPVILIYTQNNHLYNSRIFRGILFKIPVASALDSFRQELFIRLHSNEFLI